ncbi:MAG: hypothetical protein HOC23_16305 [Halieaceae bacterium]|nr:hypothetical protein [Halieaceae bacterium]
MQKDKGMRVNSGPYSENTLFYLVLLAIVMLGAWVRLSQFTLQVLLDDEWHAIHQLLFKGPKELFLTFGHADFSIPLALMYWLEQKLFGLSELGMRWPMMAAGLLTLLVFPLYVRKYFSWSTTLVFSLLLAVSPMLVLYSKTARPYALTLLLSYVAMGAFHRFIMAKQTNWKPGFVYAVCAVLGVWLHLVILPLIVAPFLAFGLPALIDRDRDRLGRIFYLGVFTLAGLLAVVVPPMLGHPEALGAKLGLQTPSLQSYYGTLFVWLGTPSTEFMLIGVFFAALGTGELCRKFPLTTSLLTGLALTFVSILLTRPAWVNHSVTLARYLLPVIPVLLLAISLGIRRVFEVVIRNWGHSGKLISLTAIISALSFMGYQSPLLNMLAKPNSNSLHSVYWFDFRSEKNQIAHYMDDFSVSPFWQELASFPQDTLKIAAGPFSFETYHWDAARWEQISQQRVMPAFFTGFCVKRRWGEVPNDRGFRFQNVAYPGEKGDLKRRGFDLLVYQKPFTQSTKDGEIAFGKDTAACGPALRERFPAPIYEDEQLVVFPVSDRMKYQINVER